MLVFPPPLHQIRSVDIFNPQAVKRLRPGGGDWVRGWSLREVMRSWGQSLGEVIGLWGQSLRYEDWWLLKETQGACLPPTREEDAGCEEACDRH